MENILLDYISKFMPLSEKEKEALLAFDMFKTFKKGAVIFKNRQIPDNSYFIIKGCIRCYYKIEGEENTTAFYTEYEPFTPQCSITENPPEYYVSCVEDSIITVATPELVKIIGEKSQRLRKLGQILTKENNAKFQFSFDEYKIYTPQQRYLKLLKSRPDLFQRVPQYQMASYLGITPQSLSRMRGRILRNTN